MENSVSDGDVHQSFRSPPRRRRSTFFERRDSIVSQPQQHEIVDRDEYLQDSEDEMRTQEMSRYLEKLLSEKEQWKREVKERRYKYDDLCQQYQMALNPPSRSRMSYSVLSSDDIDFLKGKPSISKLVDSQQKLHTTTIQTMLLVSRANELDRVLLEICEKRVNRITEHILENSTIE